MELRENTILITGGNSGIGRGLAEAFHRRGNRVIISGRREEALQYVCAANPGMQHVRMDVTDPGDLLRAAGETVLRFPRLNCVINNAGVQRAHDFAAGQPLNERAMLEEVNTNLLGLIRCCAAFVPHLTRQPRATLINVSSGLAFVPLARFPIYCATKAAVHSFTLSLRHQLRGTGVKVIELIPPWVATDLDRAHPYCPPPGAPGPMPLDAFIAATMNELATDQEEVAVADAKGLRAAGSNEMANKVFDRMNP